MSTPTPIARLAARRNIAIRHHGKDSPEAVAADRAWREAKLAEAAARYGQPDDDGETAS